MPGIAGQTDPKRLLFVTEGVRGPTPVLKGEKGQVRSLWDLEKVNGTGTMF